MRCLFLIQTEVAVSHVTSVDFGRTSAWVTLRKVADTGVACVRRLQA